VSLFPGGRALIVAIPKAFDLLSELASVRTIRLATGFAHGYGPEDPCDRFRFC
jgi:hypothetical protein